METIDNIVTRSLHGGSDDADEDQTLNNIIHIVGIIVILAMAWIFGMIPYFW